VDSWRTAKRWARTALDATTDLASLQRYFLWLGRQDRGRPLNVVDIDNTVAITWPSLLPPVLSASQRLRTLPVHAGARQWVLSAMARGEHVAFLSARPSSSRRDTEFWLQAVLGVPAQVPVFLVSSAQRKRPFWRLAARHPGGATVVDDLSFGHETGEVAHDDSGAALVLALGLRYVGYGELQAINDPGWYDPQRIRAYVEEQGKDARQAVVSPRVGAGRTG
jgi:hypothetical protein